MYLGKNFERMLRKTEGQKVKPWSSSNQRRYMTCPFEQAPHRVIKKMAEGKADFF